MTKKGGSSSETRKLKQMFFKPSNLQKIEEDLAKMRMELGKKKLELRQTYSKAKEQIKQGKREELEKKLEEAREEAKKDKRAIKHHTPYFNKTRQAIIKGEVMTGKDAKKVNEQLKRLRTIQAKKENNVVEEIIKPKSQSKPKPKTQTNNGVAKGSSKATRKKFKR